MTSSVHIVTQEDVVITANITSLLWSLPNVKEPHKIGVISMEIAEHFDRRLANSDQIWLSLQHLGHFIQKLEHLFLFDVEWTHHWNCGLTILGLEEILYE